MIHPFDSMRRWWKSGGPTAIAAETPTRSNGNGAEPAPRVAPEPPWLAQLDAAGIPRTLNYPSCTLGRLVDHAADRYGDNISMVYNEQRWTYRELLAQVNRMAGGLASLGVRRGDRILYTLPNCPEMVITFMAAQKLGAVVVNAGPLMGIDDVSTVIGMTTPRVAIGLDLQAPLLAQMNNTTVEHWIWVSLQAYQPVIKRLGYRYKLWQGGNGQKSAAQHLPLSKLLEQAPARPPTIEPDPSKTAVLQPTGGTTGTLKLAMLSHKSLIANAAQISAWMSCQAGQERFLSVLPFFHVYGLTTAMIGPMFNAASMILMTRFNARDFVEIVRREKPSVMPLVPAILGATCDEFDRIQKKDKGRKPPPITGVRLCLSGAAPLPTPLAERFTATTGVTVLEGYGLTEASPVTHINLMGKPRANSIGLPVSDTKIRVVEINENAPAPWSSFKDVAPGEPGEMLIAGPQIMLGYFANLEQSRMALVTDDAGTTWLRTGDIVRVDEEGYFHVLDRKKDMIIRSGLKVFPARVEGLLKKHKNVADVAVVGRPDATHTEIVVAVLVAKDLPEATDKTPQAQHRQMQQEKLADELRAMCREHLAPYEVPKVIEFMDVLPRSPLGKLLKRELRKPPTVVAPMPSMAAVPVPAPVSAPPPGHVNRMEKAFEKIDEERAADSDGNGSPRKTAGKKEVA